MSSSGGKCETTQLEDISDHAVFKKNKLNMICGIIAANTRTTILVLYF